MRCTTLAVSLYNKVYSCTKRIVILSSRVLSLRTAITCLTFRSSSVARCCQSATTLKPSSVTLCTFMKYCSSSMRFSIVSRRWRSTSRCSGSMRAARSALSEFHTLVSAPSTSNLPRHSGCRVRRVQVPLTRVIRDTVESRRSVVIRLVVQFSRLSSRNSG